MTVEILSIYGRLGKKESGVAIGGEVCDRKKGMVLLESAILSGVKNLFLYNRDNYIFDRKVFQQAVYHTQKMRIVQVKLFREDMRDLLHLTIKKMDHYLLINVLLLLFAGGFFYEGKLPQDSPGWIVFLWTMAIGSAILFLSISIFFAIHASITAQTFGARILTQWLRLPVPGLRAVQSAARPVQEFEKSRGGEMLRVPVVGGLPSSDQAFEFTSRTPASPSNQEPAFTSGNEAVQTELESDYATFVEHFHVFNNLQKYFAGYDAYARVTMVVGMNAFISAIGYMALAYFLLQSNQWGSLAFLIVLQTFSFFHALLNIRLSKAQVVLAGIFVFLPTTLAAVSAGAASVRRFAGGTIDEIMGMSDILAPAIFALSLGWMVFLLFLGSDIEGGLPYRFVTVQSIDVLGYDQQQEEDATSRAEAVPPAPEEPVSLTVPQAAVLQRGEALRRTKLDVARARIGEERPVDEFELDMENLSEDEESSATSPGSLVRRRTSFLGLTFGGERKSRIPGEDDDLLSEASVELSEDEPQDTIAIRKRNYKASVRMQNFPWKAYNQAGATIIILWVSAIIVSLVVVATGNSWGWPRTSPITAESE